MSECLKLEFKKLVHRSLKKIPNKFKFYANFFLKLEKEVASYKSRLDELRKAKNNLIIKKTTEYVNLGNG
jgi:hypothetical protein